MGRGRYNSRDHRPQDDEHAQHHQARDRHHFEDDYTDDDPANHDQYSYDTEYTEQTYIDDTDEDYDDPNYYRRARANQQATYNDYQSRSRSRPRASRSASQRAQYVHRTNQPPQIPQPYHTRSMRPASPLRQIEKRRVWPTLLMGCALGVFLVVAAAALIIIFAFHSLQIGGGLSNLPGIITTKQFTLEGSQEVALEHISQLQVCNPGGKVAVHVDPAVSKTVVKAKKIVRATNQTEASKKFQYLSVEVQPPAQITHALACTKPTGQVTGTAIPTQTTTSASTTASAATDALTVNVAIPNNDTLNNEVDLDISIPPGAIASDTGATIQVQIEAPQGDIAVEGLSGRLNIRGGTGDVTVKHAILTDDTHIETAQGKVTFNGFLLMPTGNTSNQAHYLIQSERGIDVTLPGNTNVTLDANTNVGAIKSDFPIKINNNGGPVNYHGPLNPSTGTPAPATLVLDVSTGNVYIHRTQP